jgi:hypothetical protein
MVNTFLVIFLNQKVGPILNLIRKISFIDLAYNILNYKKKKKKKKSTKKVKRIKINLDFIFKNFPVQRTGSQLVKSITIYLKSFLNV